jgi:hypothetical protein
VGALLGLGQMNQPDLSVSVDQLRIALLRASPHIWRRVLVPGHFTLTQLHRILRALFSWSETHPHRFLIRAKSFNGDHMPATEGTELTRHDPVLSVIARNPQARFNKAHQLPNETNPARPSPRSAAYEPTVRVPALCGIEAGTVQTG